MKKFNWMAAGILLLSACGGPAVKEPAAGEEAKAVPLVDSFTFIGDSVELPGFEIALQLSKKAEDTLKAKRESVKVVAIFSGIPKDTLDAEYLEWGKSFVGRHEIELKEGRVARFDHVRLPKSAMDALSERNFEVLINVVSGRHSSQMNLLDIGILQDGIDSVRGKRHVLKGKLIGE